MLYDKKCHWVPFAKRRSLVSLKNAITGKRVWFQRGDSFNGIWMTNFHAKLPALNRLDSLVKVFAELSKRENLTELDFMYLYYQLHSTMALLDGGIYRMLSSAETSHLSGSYSTAQQLAETGYHNTRVDHVISDGFSVFSVDKKCS